MVRTTPIGLEALQSRGSIAEKPGSLAGLHQKRQETLAQYFTPDWLSRFIWRTVSAAFKEDGYYSLLDNSIGNAAMFRYADPERVSLFGFDIDGELVNSVTVQRSIIGTTNRLIQLFKINMLITGILQYVPIILRFLAKYYWYI